jgi:hypothetical protein
VIQKVSKSTISLATQVTLTVTATDNVALHATAYSFDDGQTRQSAASKTFTENQTVTIRVRDAAGNRSSTGLIINNIKSDQVSTKYPNCDHPDFSVQYGNSVITLAACNV